MRFCGLNKQKAFFAILCFKESLNTGYKLFLNKTKQWDHSIRTQISHWTVNGTEDTYNCTNINLNIFLTEPAN